MLLIEPNLETECKLWCLKRAYDVMVLNTTKRERDGGNKAKLSEFSYHSRLKICHFLLYVVDNNGPPKHNPSGVPYGSRVYHNQNMSEILSPRLKVKGASSQ